MRKNSDETVETPIKSSDKNKAVSSKNADKKWFSSTITKLLEKNSFIKVAGAIIAVIMWFYVSMFVADEIPRDITGIPVIIEEDSVALKNFNLVPVNFDKSNTTANVSILGSRPDISALTRDDFTATLDLTKVTGPGVYDLYVDITSTMPNAPFEIQTKTINPQTVPVKFDYKETQTFQVSVSNELDEINVSSEFVKGDYQISPEKIKVTGPSGEIAKIASAEIDISSDIPSNIENTFTAKGNIVLKDALGEIIDTETLVKEKEEATVTVPVQKIKTIQLAVEFTNLPQNIYSDVIKYQLSHSTIRISGERSYIESFPDQYTISYIYLNKLDIDSVREIELELPSGIKDYDNISSVTIRLDMPNLVKRTFTSDQIKIINKPPGYSVTADVSTLSDIEIVGDIEFMSNLEDKDITVVVDMLDKEIIPGKSYKRAQIILPDGLAWAVDPVDDSNPANNYYLIPVEISQIETP